MAFWVWETKINLHICTAVKICSYTVYFYKREALYLFSPPISLNYFVFCLFQINLISQLTCFTKQVDWERLWMDFILSSYQYTKSIFLVMIKNSFITITEKSLLQDLYVTIYNASRHIVVVWSCINETYWNIEKFYIIYKYIFIISIYFNICIFQYIYIIYWKVG